MAGRNHHYIPRQLMRGFAVERGKGEQVFLFRAGQARAHPVNLTGANTMKDFYGEPDDTSLDNAITNLESNEFGDPLYRARNGSPLRAEDEHALRRFVAHLIVRTDSSRTMVGSLMTRSFDALEATVTSPEIFAEFIANDPDMMDDLIERAAQSAFEELAKSGIRVSPVQAAAIKAELRQTMRERPQSVGQEIAGKMRTALAHVQRPDISGASVQRKALATNLVPPGTLSDFEACALSIETTEQDLILGDDPVLAFSASGTPQRAMLHDDSPALYCLPIATRRLLVLRRAVEQTVPSAAELNSASAAASRRHFIARDEASEFLALINQIDTFRGEGELADITAMMQEHVPKKG